MVIAADYPFMDVLWSMVIFFCWVVWIWMMISILTDVFRRRDIGGWAKAAWTVFMIVIPFLGALVYLIANHDGMAQRDLERTKAAKAGFDEYVRSVATTNGDDGVTTQIERAKALLDAGTIDQREFEALKAKALA